MLARDRLAVVLSALSLGCGSTPAHAPATEPLPPPPATGPGSPPPAHAPSPAVRLPAALHGLAPPQTIDVDGDGLADVVMESLGSGGAGILLGGATPHLASFTLGGPDVAGAFGRDALSVGDLDRNGWNDVVIADELYQHVLVYLVGPDGVASPTVIDVPRDGAPIPNVSVAGAGDVNEDGYDDLVVGSTNAIYLHFGSASGLAPTPTRFAGTGGYGASVAGRGDVNGDHHADVVVGAADEHAIYVHLGDGHTLGAARRLDAGGRQMGDDIAIVGDVSHDGYDDVVTSGYGGNAGWLFQGSASGPGPAATELGASGDHGFSLWISAAGDVDGDGYADVVAGGYAADGAYLYRGGATGLSAEPQILAPTLPGDPWMYRVRGVGDVNGDGLADVVVDNTMLPRFLYLGRADGLAPSPLRLEARPDPTAPPPYQPPPPVSFPPVETACTTDADCERVQKVDDQCCPLCAQYVSATHAWARRVEALCAAHPGMCAISCAEGPPPTARCEAGACVLR